MSWLELLVLTYVIRVEREPIVVILLQIFHTNVINTVLYSLPAVCELDSHTGFAAHEE